MAYKVPYEIPLLDACLQGQATLSCADDYIEHWHRHNTGRRLNEELGLSPYAYNLFLRYGDLVLKEALTCRRMKADFDSVWSAEKAPELLEVCQKIEQCKYGLRDQTFLSNAATFAKLDELGQLIHGKNEITGMDEDIQYLYVDNGEFFCHVAGFIGDEAHVKDSKGQALCVGDIVSTADGWERMVFLSEKGTPILDQKYLSGCGAVRKKTFQELDLSAARCAAFSVTLNSCLKRYQMCRQREEQAAAVEMAGGMTLG